MRSTFATAFGFVAAASAAAIPQPSAYASNVEQDVFVVPHDAYSSSAGVPGCKIDINRIAYWPMEVDCNNMCIKVKANNREITVLHIDTSTGSHDISYEAWNYLNTGGSVETSPSSGAGLNAKYQIVSMDECADILEPAGGKLALTAANGPSKWFNCPADSWFRKNSVFYNIYDLQCHNGVDEECPPPQGLNNFVQCPTVPPGAQVNPSAVLPQSMWVKNVAYQQIGPTAPVVPFVPPGPTHPAVPAARRF